MQKFKTLRQPLIGELAMSRKKERERKRKMPLIVATYVSAFSQGQRTHSARTHNTEYWASSVVELSSQLCSQTMCLLWVEKSLKLRNEHINSERVAKRNVLVWKDLKCCWAAPPFPKLITSKRQREVWDITCLLVRAKCRQPAEQLR